MHRSKSVNEKKLVLIKKRTFFVQNVPVDTWIAFFSKLSKSCRKIFKQGLLQIRIWGKINKFPEAVFLQEPCTSGQMNCGFEHLTKTFLPIFRDKILHKPKRTWFFLNDFFLPWKFSSGDVVSFYQNPAENFSFAVRKKFCD